MPEETAIEDGFERHVIGMTDWRKGSKKISVAFKRYVKGNRPLPWCLEVCEYVCVNQETNLWSWETGIDIPIWKAGLVVGDIIKAAKSFPKYLNAGDVDRD